MTLAEIGRSQISGGCPYEVLNSQCIPTRPEAMNEMNVPTLQRSYGWTWIRHWKGLFYMK